MMMKVAKNLMKRVRTYMVRAESPAGRLVIMGGLLMMVSAAPALAQAAPMPGGGGDLFGGIVDMISTNMGKWSGALIASGLLGLGWEFMRGSSQSGERFKAVLLGSIILIITGTAGGVLPLISTIARYAGPGR
jgi:hypothetical protein